MLRWVSDVFWEENVWLPPDTKWLDVSSGPDKDVTYTNIWDVLASVPIAGVLIVLRFVLDKYVFAPFGKSLGIKHNRNKKAPPNNKLEAAYKANLDPKKARDMIKELDMSERQLQRWWRLRRRQDKPSTLTKFCESMWRSTFLLYNFTFGLLVLWDKKWLWEIDHCYIGYPHQGLTNDIWWYYIISFAFYWSQTITVYTDVRRKDFRQTVAHHLATLTLLFLSWACNAHRTGSLVLMVHDPSEMLLEATKAVKYANYDKSSVFMFVVFTILWIVTRLGIYPYIIWSITYRGEKYVPRFPVIDVFVYLLYLLLALNAYWTWLILQIAYKAIVFGERKGDIRSSSSEVSGKGLNSDTRSTGRDSFKKA